jgi:two-component system cell cycle sensor histidine kinase/response regulator CckA
VTTGDAVLEGVLADKHALQRELVEVRATVARLEDELSRLRDREEAAARRMDGVVHGFKNVMTVIEAYGERLLGAVPAEHPLRAPAEQLTRAGAWGSVLARRALAVEAAPTVGTADVNAAVGAAAGLLGPLLPPTVELTLALDPAVGRAQADQAEVEHILLDLLLNARDALSAAGGRVHVATTVGGDEGAPATARIEICDTGPGLAPGVRGRLFQRGASTAAAAGRGIGLASVLDRVSRFAGRVAVASEPGQGTRVAVELPRAAAPVAAPAAPAPGRSGRLLVVEDRPELRDLMAQILRLHGYDVLEARTTDEALAMDVPSLDLVVTDVMFASLRGDELVARLARRHPGLRALYVSGYLDEDLERAVARTSDRALLYKPFTLDGLLDKVQALLAG